MSIIITADCTKPGEQEGGVLGAQLIEQTIFKSIWAKYVLFVVWPHKECGGAPSGPPATNYNYLQTV